jgi:septum formation protein
MKLILASASPRRKELLSYIGYEFEIQVADINEEVFLNEDPVTYVKRMSQEKCQTIARNFTDAVVIGADTIVVLEGDILGKPIDKKDAEKMLRALSGRVHQVYSAFSIITPGSGIPRTRSVCTEVFFKELHEDEIHTYLEIDEPYDKAGAYAIQGVASKFIPEIHGSVTNVIGLPLFELEEELKTIEGLFHG